MVSSAFVKQYEQGGEEFLEKYPWTYDRSSCISLFLYPADSEKVDVWMGNLSELYANTFFHSGLLICIWKLKKTCYSFSSSHSNSIFLRYFHHLETNQKNWIPPSTNYLGWMGFWMKTLKIGHETCCDPQAFLICLPLKSGTIGWKFLLMTREPPSYKSHLDLQNFKKFQS